MIENSGKLIAKLREIVEESSEDLVDIRQVKENFWGESNTDDAVEAGHSLGYNEGRVELAKEILAMLET